MSDLRRQKQAYRHDPANGVFGDCNRTAIACVLGVERDELPHVHRDMNSEEFEAFTKGFLADRGLHLISVPVNAPSVSEAMLFGHMRGGGIPFILGGQSPRGVNHSVVCFSQDDLHDPGLEGGGLVGPCEPDGFFWCDWIVKLPGLRPLQGDGNA